MINNKNHIIGIDIGGTKIAAALFDADGNILDKQNEKISNRKGKAVSNLAIELALILIKKAEELSLSVKAIGIAVPGIYHPNKQTVWAPNIPGWEAYPLLSDFQKSIKNKSINIESDRSCYILGEVWKGCAKDCKNALFIAVGTGIGLGILCNGQLINGNSGIAGAIGWLALVPPYFKKYDACGNFEFYASGDGIARSAAELLNDKPNLNSLLAHISLDKITAHDVFDAFEKQDLVAVQVIEKAIQYWGMVVANLTSIFNPEKIIFGGGVFGPAAVFIDKIQAEAKKWAQPISIQEVSVEASTLEGNAGLIGAAYAALRIEQNHKI